MRHFPLFPILIGLFPIAERRSLSPSLSLAITSMNNPRPNTPINRWLACDHFFLPGYAVPQAAFGSCGMDFGSRRATQSVWVTSTREQALKKSFRLIERQPEISRWLFGLVD